jgi:rhodanese-related sulfurtransferase
MAEIQSFIVDNLVLSGILGCVVVAYVIFEVFMGQVQNTIEVSTQKAVDLLNHEHALLLDIRPLEDFNHCHCLGSISVHAAKNKLEQFKDKPVVVICNSGRTSIPYAKELLAKGFKQAFSMSGGIIGWKNADFPIASGK